METQKSEYQTIVDKADHVKSEFAKFSDWFNKFCPENPEDNIDGVILSREDVMKNAFYAGYNAPRH